MVGKLVAKPLANPPLCLANGRRYRFGRLKAQQTTKLVRGRRKLKNVDTVGLE